MPTLRLTEGSTHLPVDATLQDANEDPLDLTDAVRVQFRMSAKHESGYLIDRPAEVVDAETGHVRHRWQSHDINTPGTFRAAFYIRFNDGSSLWVPSGSEKFTVVVTHNTSNAG